MQNRAKKNVWCKMCYRIKLFAACISIHIAQSSFIRNYVLNVAHFCCACILWAFFTLCRIYIFKQPTSFSTAPHIYIRRFSTLSHSHRHIQACTLELICNSFRKRQKLNLRTFESGAFVNLCSHSFCDLHDHCFAFFIKTFFPPPKCMYCSVYACTDLTFAISCYIFDDKSFNLCA